MTANTPDPHSLGAATARLVSAMTRDRPPPDRPPTPRPQTQGAAKSPPELPPLPRRRPLPGPLPTAEIPVATIPVTPESPPVATPNTLELPEGDRPNGALPQRSPWNWITLTSLGILVSGGVGLLAVALLLKLPALPNCPAIFWPMASASMRLYCAQVAANKQTVADLLEAISLVNSLPADHPRPP
ncbi:hypothetical protein [Neosynechococcus sphagnicola]|uniref:hypothetical protein n=1 Tax=Neosynechococcus sphagnicola TaxID=1501145 RepID=UPI0012E08793|nr:hypothetical protein [Neosynechococcus sphagnicola]